ncbi:hypothetical protein FPOAC2_03942 [Fusarium poae]|uniref:hypothetical protein n=1 Tax=Fusarium poae TaxID=36050 RepID=UPI001CE79BD7|nr:hypothetical protein FPOAC1_003830 [Fusarium poae]KAG8677802.1 hypothetical protein FPOAC1_003830 [Fusarium poae]
MRSFAFLLAIGLFGVDSALAGPCKPRASTMDAATSTSIDSTMQSITTTAGETTTVASSETLTETVATTVALDTTTAITITASETETTTTASEAVTTTAEVTTTAPLATPTFTIVGGGGSVSGSPIKGTGQDGSVMLFNPEGGNARTRTFTLDPKTGRLRDKDTGISICAYYGLANSPSDPAYFSFCQNGNIGPNLAYEYLTCDIVDGKLACTSPRGSCPMDDDGNFLGCFTDPAGGMNNQFYYQYKAGAGYYLFISSGNPSGYTPVDIIAQNA